MALRGLVLRIAAKAAIDEYRARKLAEEEKKLENYEPEVDTKDLRQVQEELQELSGQVPHVAVRALNKAMKGTKTDMVAIVRESHTFKATALRKRLKINRATRADISGSVESRGNPIHLTDMAGTRQTKKGVTVNVKKDTGRQLIPRAFKAKSKTSGKEMVLRRPGKDTYSSYQDMYGRYGPAGTGGTVMKRGRTATLLWFPAPYPESVYNTPDTWAKVEDAAAKRLDENIGREIDAEFRRLEGKW